MRKNLAKAFTLGIALAGVCTWGGDSNFAYATDTYGTVDVDGYKKE